MMFPFRAARFRPCAILLCMKHDADVLLLSAGAGRILNLTPAGVRALERRGELPAERTESGVRLFSRVDVERLARERAARRLPPDDEAA